MTMLFSPLKLRDVTFPNRATVAPMCQYAAKDGFAHAWHLVHLGTFARGGFGAVMTEAAAVVPEGRITHGDIGLWSDAHAQALKPSIEFIQAQGALAGIQLAHAGRKASMQRPWFGNGPLSDADFERGDMPWEIFGASDNPVDAEWLVPHALSHAEIADLVDAFVAGTVRAEALGCDFIEVHGAHGYLLQSFLSPASNMRSDAYGGNLQGRARFPLEVARAVREVWPDSKPLFFRISAVDGFEGGWDMDDSVALAKMLKDVGVDVIDCSSGGNKGRTKVSAGQKVMPGYQLAYSERVRSEVGIATQGVGMILDGAQAEAALQSGQADLIAIGRQALYDPFWVHHQADALGVGDFERWGKPYGWWLERRAPSIEALKE